MNKAHPHLHSAKTGEKAPPRELQRIVKSRAAVAAVAPVPPASACGSGSGDSSSSGGGHSGRGRPQRAGDGRLCRDPAGQRSARAGAAWPRRRLPGLRCPSAGVRSDLSAVCSAKARWFARARRSTRSIRASITRRPRRPRPTSRARAPRRRPRGRWRLATQPLVEQQAISKQDYTNAVAQARQADASVAQNTAALRSAQINQRFTRVPAPITGRIGLSNVTEGALVTANQTDALDHDHSARPGLCRYPGIGGRPARAPPRARQGGVVPTTAQVRLKLPDGSDYGLHRDGRVQPGRGQPEHRHRHAARALSQSAVDSACPACS